MFVIQFNCVQCLVLRNSWFQLLQTDKVTGNYTTTVDSLTQPYNSATGTVVAPTGVFSPAPAMKLPSASRSASSLPAFLHDSSDTINSGNQVTKLLNPSTFFAPPSSSSLLVPPVSSSAPSSAAFHNFLNQPRQYGAPMLQAFPPPNPPQSLTPISASTPNKPIIIREKVRDALLSLVQVML